MEERVYTLDTISKNVERAKKNFLDETFRNFAFAGKWSSSFKIFWLLNVKEPKLKLGTSRVIFELLAECKKIRFKKL